MTRGLTTADLRSQPFAHTTALGVIDHELCKLALQWMEVDAPWALRIANFYEQWEVHLDQSKLPIALRTLLAPSTVSQLTKVMLAPLTSKQLILKELTAHKLVPGQTIRVHNDYLDEQETHRLLVQLNRGWSDSQGGLLMLFASSSPDDVRRIIRPLHGSVMAFPITRQSFHAVSTIQQGERYTLVYSFREFEVG
jgi:Rps23 Pro-64 3,4-dihydroxylase Tpa1-like proline 4-hydroxylase